MSQGRALTLLIASCSIESLEPSSDKSACERAAEMRAEQCGTVYEFAAPCDNELGRMEICLLDADLAAAEAKYGPARYTTRGDFKPPFGIPFTTIVPPCFWPGPGCNALCSCWPHERCVPK